MATQQLRAEVLIRQGTDCMRRRELQQAEAAFQEARSVLPSDSSGDVARSTCSLQMGVLCLVKERFTEAAAHFDAVDETEEPSVWRYRGIVAQCTGDLERAAEAFRRLLAVQPANANAMAGLARCYQEQGQLEQAEPLFRKAAQCAEGVDGGRCHYEFGCCLGAMGRGSEAIQEFQACLRVGGVQPGFVHLELGLALAGMGQHQQALRHLEAAARASPHLAVVHHTLGVVLTAVEQVDLAKAAFTTALGLDPGSVRSMQGLAAAQAAGGDRAAAIKTLREAVRLADDDPALLTLLGDALLREGLLADAEALFVKALHSNPASQPLLDRLANLRFPIHTSFALLVAPGSESGQHEEDMGGVEASLLEQGYLKENIFSLSGAVATPKNVLTMLQTLNEGPLLAAYSALMVYVAAPVGLYEGSSRGADHDKAFLQLEGDRLPCPRLYAGLSASPASKMLVLIDGTSIEEMPGECTATAAALKHHANKAKTHGGSPLAMYLTNALAGAKSCVRPAAKFLEGGCYECRRMRDKIQQVGVTATDLLTTLEYHLTEHGLADYVCLHSVQMDQALPQDFVVCGREPEA